MKNSRKLLLIAAVVIFTIAGLVFIGNIAYPSIYGYFNPKSKMSLKSDAEIIAQFQARKADLNQILQKIAETEKELQPMKAERNKKIGMLNDELKKNEEINKNNPQLKEKERLRLWNEIGQTRQSLITITNEKLSPINKETKRLEFNLISSLKEANGDFKVDPKIEFSPLNSYHNYEKKHFWGRNSELYFIRKGFVKFSENKQPDSRLVVDNLDKYSSGNIKFIVPKVESIFGESSTIYVHIEDNWYLFLSVNMIPDFNPDDLP